MASSGIIAAAAGNLMLTVELLLLALALALASTGRFQAGGAYAAAERWLVAIAVRPRLSLLAIALLSVAARLAVLPLLPFPRPVGRDESSLALLAETFARGRLANPAHPFSDFFESVYVHQVPTYGSMYFPGRALELALGLRLFESAAAGSMLVLAAAAAAIVWMLRGWLRPTLAFAGGLIFIVKFLVFSALANQAVGHGAALLAGAMVIGALPRLQGQIRWRHSIVLALGVALLAITRPYEGVLLCLPIAIVLMIRLWGLVRAGEWRPVLRLAAPAVLAIGGAVALLAIHNIANTGTATLTPYTANRTEYAGTPGFLFQPATIPTRAAPEPLAGYYKLEGKSYFDHRSPIGMVRSVLAKLKNVWGFFIGPLLTLPFLWGLGWLRRQRVLAACLLLSMIGFMPLQFSWAHYQTPMASILMLVIMAGFDRLRQSPRGRSLSRTLPTGLALSLAVPVASLATGTPRLPISVIYSCCYLSDNYRRWPIEDRLAATPGKHLVFVHYRPQDSRWGQWVYNHADIDGSVTIWAHDLGERRNAELIAHYPDRQAWWLDGLDPARLAPYARRSQTDAAAQSD